MYGPLRSQEARIATKTRTVVAISYTLKDGSTRYKARYYCPDYSACEVALKKGNNYCSGHTKGASGFKTEAEALERGYELQAALKNGPTSIISASSDTVTMNEVCTLWLASPQPAGKRCARTMRNYSERWRALTNRNAVIGMTPIASVNKARVLGWLDHLYDAGLSASTMNQDLVLLRHLSQFAVGRGLIPQDFTDGIKSPDSKQGKPSKRARMTPDDLRAVAAHIGGTLGDAVLLNLHIGLRLGSLLGLKASSIDRTGVHYVIHITEQWDEGADNGSGRGLYRLPKRGKTRSIPVTLPEMRALIDQHLLTYQADSTEHGIIFATRNRTHFQQTNFRKFWDRAIRELGIKARPMPGADPFGKLTPHSMRATMIDFWIDAGLTFDALAPIVGHSDPAFTRKTYYRDLTIDDTTAAMLAVTAAATEAHHVVPIASH